MNSAAEEHTSSYSPAQNGCIPIRKMHYGGKITVRFLNADGTEPATGTPDPAPRSYPETSVLDNCYKLHDVGVQRKTIENLLWLSDNNPLLFEEFLCFLEGMDGDHSESITRLIKHGLQPERVITEAYIYAYYRQLMNTSNLFHLLASEGWHGAKSDRAWSLFVSARTACGYTVEHPHFKAAILAVWIMQDIHHPLKNTFWVKDYVDDVDFIHRRFSDVYDARHELRMRGTIGHSSVEEYLKHHCPLRLGSL